MRVGVIMMGYRILYEDKVMKIDNIHSRYHTPGFKGDLHRFTEKLEPEAHQYLTTNLSVISRGLAKANAEGLKVVDAFSERVAELLRTFGIQTRKLEVPDQLLMVDSVDNLLDKYLYA